MVDMEPAQQGQAVGVRWEAKQRLTTNGMFPPYKKHKNRASLEHQKCDNTTTCRFNSSPERSDRSAGDDSYESISDPENLIWIAKKEFYQCTK